MMRLLVCILALLLGGYGYLSIRHPEDAIYLANFMRFKDFEPSEAYIRWTRVGGVVYIVLAVLVIVGAFVAL